MTITLEAIRAAGGIVHSDGNIFFRDISMLQGLAGAAPAAGAPQDVVAWMHPETLNVISAAHKHDMSTEYGAETRRKAESHSVALVRAGEPAAAAPALEAPAAPGVPAGFALVPIKPTQQMLDAGRWSGAGSVSIQEEWARKEVWSRMLATVAPPPAAYADDLVALVVNLVQALSAAAPDNDLAGHALDYLKRNGLQGSPLRAAETAPQAPAAPPADERAAYVEFLAGKFQQTYSKEDAEHWWDHGHVSALTWKAARALAAPAAPSEGLEALLNEALAEVKRIVDAEQVSLAPTYHNEVRRPNDKRKFHMGDARRAARNAAAALEKAFDVVIVGAVAAPAAPAAPAVDAELLELAQAIVKYNRQHGGVLAVHINNLADLVDERAARAAQAAAKGEIAS
jgi:hypothetical protein